MRQDRDNFNPKPRPRSGGGYSPMGNSSRPNPLRPNQGFGQSRPPQRGYRPPPPPRRNRPAGPTIIAPKLPASGKQKRRMLKAAAWRLAALLRMRPSAVLAPDAVGLEKLVEAASSRVDLRGRIGDASRLAAKIVRLRK